MNHAITCLMVSRGRGMGHAVPDMSIAKHILSSALNINMTYASYDAGATAYRAHGFDVVDLNLPADPSLWDITIPMLQLLITQRPSVVISHEEIVVPPLAKALNIPCIFITDFFTDPSHLFMQALKYADEIIFTAHAGIYTLPPYLRGKTFFVGPAVRKFSFTLADRVSARQDLNLDAEAVVLLVQPGGWTESSAPISDLLFQALDLLSEPNKMLIWLAGKDYDDLLSRTQERDDILVVESNWQIDKLMVASDVVITKANRLTVYEAASLGIPTISISHLHNWPDDVAVAEIASNVSLMADSATPKELAAQIKMILSSGTTKERRPAEGIDGAARRIVAWIERVSCNAP